MIQKFWYSISTATTLALLTALAPLSLAAEGEPRRYDDWTCEPAPAEREEPKARKEGAKPLIIRKLPPDVPIQFWFSDGVFYHYVLSCCEGTPDVQDYGLLSVDEPIDTIACPVVHACEEGDAKKAEADCVTCALPEFDFCFEGEPQRHQHPTDSQDDNVHPLSFRGADLPGNGKAAPLPIRPYHAKDGDVWKPVKFRMEIRDFPELNDKWFVLYEVASPKHWRGPSVAGDGQTYTAVEVHPDYFRDVVFLEVAQPLRLRASDRACRSVTCHAENEPEDGPLYVADLDFPRDFPGQVGQKRPEVSVYIVTLNGEWGQVEDSAAANKP